MNKVEPQWRFKSVKKWASRRYPRQQTEISYSVGRDASDEFLRAIVDACVTSVAVLDELGSVLYASKPWRLFEQNVCAGTIDGKSAQQFFKSCRSNSRFNKHATLTLADDIQQILAGSEKEFHGQYYHRSRTTQRRVLIHGARLDLPGSVVRVLISHEDATINSEKRLAQLLDSTKILAWEGVAEGQLFTYVSEQAVEMLGYPVAQWYEPNFFASHIHPDDRDGVLAAYQKQIRIAEHFDITFRMVASDGHIVWIQNLVSVAPETGVAGSMHGFMIDVSDRKRAEKALQDLGGRLITAQEEERKRVARELHDDLNQRLALLSIQLAKLGNEIEESNTRQRLEKMQSQVQEISTDIHRLAYRLHPSKLDHLGLAAAVKSLCNEISSSGKLKVTFLERELPNDVPKDITLCLFRIAQELLRNSVKHSGAQSAHVYLRRTGNAICLTVSDNGCGFNTETELMEKGLGFISMKERLHIVGGETNIFSKPDRGTCVNVSVPLNREFAAGSPGTTQQELQTSLLSSIKAETDGSEKALITAA